jgi:hypothetical protein
MGARGEQIASKYEQACRDFNGLVERLSDADWKKTTSENWTVAATAHHVAGGHAAISGLVQLIGKGQPLPALTIDMIHANNAKHAQDFANASKVDTLALLKENSGKAAGILRGLSDADFDRTASLLGGPPMSAAQAAEGILINHVNEHLGSIRAATGQK